MKHKLGEAFTWHGQTLAVAEVKDQEEPCSGCWFFEHAIPCYGNELNCMDYSRRYHTNVIFKQSTKTEEL